MALVDTAPFASRTVSGSSGKTPSQAFILCHHLALGDIVTMTALVRDLALTYPGQFAMTTQTSFQDVWLHNPYLTKMDAAEKKRAGTYRLDYGGHIPKVGRPMIHFLSAWHAHFQARSGIKVSLLHPKPDLHLSEEEKNNRLVAGRYWVIVAGGKSDFTTKHWVYSRHQEVVDALSKCGLSFVQVGSRDKGSPKRPSHHHPTLTGVLDLTGKTNIREMFRLIYHSEGVICTITSAMHIAAAFDKPCVVTAGGREEPYWEGYYNRGDFQFGKEASEKVSVEHRYLHTMGLLDCCRQKACWRNKVTRQEKDSRKSYCHKTTEAENGQIVPVCMDMIKTTHVVEAVMSYYSTGMLPPIGPAPTIILPGGEKLEPKETPAPTSPKTPSLIVEPRGNVATPVSPAKATNHVAAGDAVLDHEHIGGKFTVFVLLYGDYFDMHQRCLNAILSTCPKGRIDLRVGSNSLGDRSLIFLDTLKERGQVSRHYRHPGNDRKYPVMREMFHDPENPITTKWLIWFDDDSMCDKNKRWLTLLAQHAIQHKDRHMFGAHRFSTMNQAQIKWVKEASWYKGKMFRDRTGKPSPNGNHVHFVVGAHWMLSVEAMRVCGIPDARASHRFDVLMGEMLWQNDFAMKDWNGNKQIVNWSSVPRRGLNEKQIGT